MAQLNYGINCEDSKKAQKLFKHIGSINIFKNDLDVFEERITVVSNGHLLDEIEKFSKNNAGAIQVQIWSHGIELDDAEASGELEVAEFEGMQSPRGSSVPVKLASFKSYSGSKENIDKFKSWIKQSPPDQLLMISEWEPEVEFGSYGIEYQCSDQKFDKVADKQWMSKGVITEKLKSK